MATIIREKMACAYFFVMPALAYGGLTARLPALKALTGIDDAQIGMMLLALGCSTLAGLIACNFLIIRFTARLVTGFASVLLACALIAAGFAASFWQMTIFCLIAGLGVGLCDVGMNALGILIEQRNGIFCLSFLHGCSSVGGVTGSLAGSLFARLELSPFINFTTVLGAFLLLWPWAYNNLAQDSPGERKPPSHALRNHIPLFVCLCGLLNLVCHVAEGSAGEWGSLLLHSAKGASQQTAALVFAFFTGAMVICRFATDSLRHRISDFFLTCAGSLLGAAGMATVLLSPSPAICLLGYALMGAGLAPVAPILFSRAGATPGVSAGQASAIVSVFSYAGMLFIPPFLGIAGKTFGLAHALWIIVALCILLAVGCVILRKK